LKEQNVRQNNTEPLVMKCQQYTFLYEASLISLTQYTSDKQQCRAVVI